MTTRRAGGRNPTWERDELILALDLYLRRGMLSSSDEEVVALSELLNVLPLHPLRPDADLFRNPNGVALKLANFAALDPAYSGRGMSRHGKGDAEVWQELADDPPQVSVLAAAIREEASQQLDSPLSPDPEEDSATEGWLLFRRHRQRERNPGIVNRKKSQTLRETGRLACEACDMDFGDRYGELGRGFIECHHVLPLSAVPGERTTRLADLVLVCSNCHRMIHLSSPMLDVAGIRRLLN